jgi:hypothetical protein
VINGTRSVFGENIGSVDWLTAIVNANDNTLELSVQYAGRRLELQAGYTLC